MRLSMSERRLVALAFTIGGVLLLNYILSH